MADESEWQLDIEAKAGMRFFTFALRDALGRETPGQMEASSEEDVRRFLAERGYEVIEIRQGWRAMEFPQSPAARAAAVEEAVQSMVEAILSQASQQGADAVRISLDAGIGRVVISHLASGEWRPASKLAADVYPALRDWLAEKAGVGLAGYARRYGGTLPPEVGGRLEPVGVVFEANTTELSLGTG